MKKMITAALCALLLMTMSAAAAQGVSLDGVIEPAKTLSILAPYSGLVGDFSAEAGDVLAEGEALFTLSTQKVYADFDGTVTGVFAEPGDSAASVEGRYGALMYMEREAVYSAACTTNGAASDNENRIVHVGETVYVQSTNDTKRDGVAVVTSVSGKDYTLDVLLYDELKVNDSVKVYRESDHDGDSCIGSGKISRIDPVAVTAQGHVLAVHVKNGDEVSRGDLLMEIVPDALAGMAGGDGRVTMPQDGVLLSVAAAAGVRVNQDDVLATWCPAGELRLRCMADEEDAAKLEIGQRMTVTFDANPEKPIDAVVAKISAAADENGEYAVLLTLDKTEGVRIGMSATAEL